MLLTLTIVPPRPPADRLRRESAGAVQRPRDIDAEKARRRLGVRVEQRNKRKIGGVVDQNVGRAEALDRRGHDPRAVGGEADVGGDDQDVAAHLLDQRRGAGERGLRSAGDRDVGALAGEGAGDGKADPRPAAGDDGGLAGEVAAVHRDPLNRNAAHL